MSACLAPTSDLWRQWDRGIDVEQKKGILSGPKFGSRYAWMHIHSCPQHTYTSAHTDSVSSLLLSPSPLLLFPTDVLDSEWDHISGGRETTRRRHRGSRSLVPRLVWGKCSVRVCANACVNHLSNQSMRSLLLAVLTEASLHGDARPALGLLLECRWWSLTQHWREFLLSQSTTAWHHGQRRRLCFLNDQLSRDWL